MGIEEAAFVFRFDAVGLIAVIQSRENEVRKEAGPSIKSDEGPTSFCNKSRTTNVQLCLFKFVAKHCSDFTRFRQSNELDNSESLFRVYHHRLIHLNFL